MNGREGVREEGRRKRKQALGKEASESSMGGAGLTPVPCLDTWQVAVCIWSAPLPRKLSCVRYSRITSPAAQRPAAGPQSLSAGPGEFVGPSPLGPGSGWAA